VVVVVVVSVVVVPVPLVSVLVTVSDSITSVTPGGQRPTVSEGQDSSALEEEEGNTKSEANNANDNTDPINPYEIIWFI
jgi:hypothetical protein